MVSRAKREGRQFLNIKLSWSDEEKEVFASGVNQYMGKPREIFCGLAGLSVSYIESCGDAPLRLAAVNIGVAPDTWADAPPATLRRRLRMFIHFG